VNRRIVSSEDVVVGVDRLPDGYFDRVLKCIPVEVVTVYVVLASAAQSAFEDTTLRWWLFLLFAGGLIAAPAYARTALAIRRYSQLAMTAAAFVVVVAATGGWFGTLDWWNGFFPLLASVLFGVTVAMLGFGPAKPRPTKTPAVPGTDDDTRAGDEATTELAPSDATAASPDPSEESGLLRVWRGSSPSR
jgi:hypothetical protein